MKKCFLSIVLLFSIAASSQNSMLSVVGNTDLPQSRLTSAELQSICMGTKPSWITGANDKVTLVMMNFNTAAGKTICEKVYHMSPDEVKKYWLALSIKGTVKAPIFVGTAAEVLDYVSKNRYAIGITDQPAVIAHTKTVFINGQGSF